MLENILKKNSEATSFPGLLVGNDTKDDAAVFDLGNGTSAISTTDFFMPIVDDPFLFGQIASVNALSDIYAMGGKPLMAISILGWPVDKLSAAIAREVVRGARKICSGAGIPLAGGHSIDNPEPLFGLAVTGLIKNENIKRNNTAREGDFLYLTKPLGVGIITTAQKKGIVNTEDLNPAIELMLTLNSMGSKLGELSYINALTDVTGFGLLGHLLEICEGSNCSATIDFSKIPLLDNLHYYLELKSFPGGTARNLDSYGEKIRVENEFAKLTLADPQTSGGLLISVDESGKPEFEKFLKKNSLKAKPIGRIIAKTNKSVIVV
jgi:selenide,water dikinase